MSLLDDAIKQHLELKRKHGASEDELRELEDQAFGAGTRPGDEDVASPEGGSPESGGIFDEAAEAPTQFLGEAATDTAPPFDAGAEIEETSVREAEAASTLEPAPETGESAAAEAPAATEGAAPFDEAAPEPPAPPVADDAGEDPCEVPPYRLEDEGEADEPSAMEHEIAPAPDESSEEPPEASAPDPAEEPIAAPPEAPGDDGPESSDQPPEASSGATAPGALSPEEREEIASQPTQFYDFELEEGVDSSAADHAAIEESNFEEETGEETFFDEQSLSDELDQALDAPGEAATAPALEPEAEDDEDAGPPPPPPAQQSESESESEDLLEETPDFLQDTPEGERLWFEQKPPKDFDFDD